MGDFIIITLMVSSFWLLWEIIRVVSMEWLNRDEITLPAGELGRSELLRCADSFEQLSGMFQGMVTKKEELSGQDHRQCQRGRGQHRGAVRHRLCAVPGVVPDGTRQAGVTCVSRH